MNTFRRLLLAAAIALPFAASFTCPAASAQDLADRKLELAMRRSFLWEYWAARQQEQIDFAHYRSYAQFGQYGQRYAAPSNLSNRAYGPQQFYGAALQANRYIPPDTCSGPFGIECSPLDCDCDPYGDCY